MNKKLLIPLRVWKIMRMSFHQLVLFVVLSGISYAHEMKGQAILEKRVSLDAQGVRSKKVLSLLEEQTDARFIYSPKSIDTQRKVRLKVINERLEVVLKSLLKPYFIEFAVSDDRMISLRRVPVKESTTTQLESIFEIPERKVSGRVTSEDGEALPGVNILVKGTTIGTTTNTEGDYVLSVPTDDAILNFSFIGYKSQEVTVGNQSEINVKLETDVSSLKEVIVVGYGTQSRETITTSVSKLDTKVLENVPYANVASAMQGALSGVRVQTISGQPGATPRVIVRGGTSINNPDGAEPLYVIDGVIRSINNISPDDIETIQVLKDAVSTAVYGARGSNGVVIVTTKSGKAGKTDVSYSANVSFSQPGKLYKLASARDYLTFSRRAFIYPNNLPGVADYTFEHTLPTGFGTGNDLTDKTAYTTQYLTAENEHKLAEGWESMQDPLDPGKTLIFKDTNWQDVLFRNATTQNHHLAISGGNEKTTFSASLGVLDNGGTAITTDFKRYTLNLRSSHQVSDKLNVFGAANLGRTVDHQVNDITNIFARGITLPPTTKYTFEDGSLAPGQAESEANPEYLLKSFEAENRSERLLFSLGANWKILDGLHFEPGFSWYSVNNDSYNFRRAFLNGPGNFVDNRNASSSNYQWRQTQLDGVFSYVKTLAKFHNIDAKAGFSYFDRSELRLSASGRGASSDHIPTLNASATPLTVSSSKTDLVLMGYFGSLNYDFRKKYLLTFNIRYDGASNLGANYRWGVFPGVSVGWNVHDERFWTTMGSVVNLMKVRASYGLNGNISGLGDFAAQGAYSVGSRYSGLAGVQNTTIANRELRWEESQTLNFGLDAGLFNNRINLLFDVYRRVTNNLITALSLPPSTGFTSVQTNLGSLENKGIELELNANILPATTALQWNVAFNVSKVRNKILKLPPNGAENNRVGGNYVWDPEKGDYNWLGGLQEGGRVGDYYEYRQIGVYATDEEASQALPDRIKLVDISKFGGDAIWDDIDKNGVIDDRDRVYVGNPFPTLTGGISNTLKYKNLYLTLRADYTAGHTIFNYARAFMEGRWKTNMNFPQDIVDNSWQEQGDQTDIPRYYRLGGTVLRNINPVRTSQRYYERGDYLAIREVTLSYNLPKSILNRIKMSNIRLYSTANNLYYFTSYKGLNPEIGGQDYGRYPIPKNFIFGINITL